jgi:hypothetical protein
MTEEPTHEGQASLHDMEVICLDYGEKCTGDFCPAFGLPRVLMGVRLAKALEAMGEMPTIQAKCQGCDAVTTLNVVDESLAVCQMCGATSRWYHIETEDGEFIAVGTLPA